MRGNIAIHVTMSCMDDSTHTHMMNRHSQHDLECELAINKQNLGDIDMKLRTETKVAKALKESIQNEFDERILDELEVARNRIKCILKQDMDLLRAVTEKPSNKALRVTLSALYSRVSSTIQWIV